MMIFIFTLISFLASVVGAICGIGGGVIIKPLLDAFQLMDVKTISFLSGCTVLAMSTYSVGRAAISGDSMVNYKLGTPLAIGAAIGGIVGKSLFQVLLGMFPENYVGFVQAVCLLLITAAALFYTLNKKKIKTKVMTQIPVCLIIGLLLGMMSAFLGIGGGPVNLVVLYFFFSMTPKEAAQNSLYIILFSQITSLLNTIATGTIPAFPLMIMIGMVAGGLAGGMIGRKVNKKIDDNITERMFIYAMIVIIGINIYNLVGFIH
ncbi:MAG TPA: sulfite exporter TauE/SafE family protein [Candidatus Merdenecus merdavium]|nr:sulfite exporter TauE/SafE family protein [Candidatus Merdenecus merdavium]